MRRESSCLLNASLEFNLQVAEKHKLKLELQTKISTQRKKPGGWIGRTQQRGPNGRGICRWCEVEVPKGRRTFCGAACVYEWRLRTDPGYLREQVFARDRGLCKLCGLDSVEFYRRFRLLAARKRNLLRRRLDLPLTRRSFWEADHIVAVVEGGGECDLSNLRTLCRWCHLNETAKLRTRLAASSRKKPHSNLEPRTSNFEPLSLSKAATEKIRG